MHGASQKNRKAEMTQTITESKIGVLVAVTTVYDQGLVNILKSRYS